MSAPRGQYPNVTSAPEHEFVDALTGRVVVLVIAEKISETGVRHAGIEWNDGNTVKVGCDELAHVSPDLDCAGCGGCGWQCRISGAWFMDLWRARPESGGSESEIGAQAGRTE